MSTTSPAPIELQELSACINSGQIDQAIARATGLIEKFPNESKLHFLYGLAVMNRSLDEAIGAFQSALDLQPDFFDAANNLGVCQFKQARYSNAIETFCVAVRLQPSNPDAMANLASALGALGKGLIKSEKFAEGADYLRRAVEIKPEDFGSLTNLGMALINLGESAEAARHLQHAVRLAPGDIRPLANLAVALTQLNQPSEAILERVLAVPLKNHKLIPIKIWAALRLDRPDLAFSYKTQSLNVMDYAALSTLYRSSRLRDQIAALPELRGQRPSRRANPLIYAAGDGVYAQRYARPLIESALSRCPDTDCHIHIMNLGGFNPDLEFAGLPLDRLTWSFEEIGPCDKGLYATRRWIRLAQIQSLTARTIIALDIDCIVNGDLPRSLSPSFDAVIYERPTQVFAHQSVAAGFLAVAPSGQDFVEFLVAYILHFEERGEQKWFDDQINIVAAREWFRRNVPSAKVIAAIPQMMDWSGTNRPDCLTWHPKGSLKEL